MQSEWKRVCLRDVARLASGGTPSMRNPEYWGGEVPWASAKDMKHLRLSETEKTLTSVGASNGTRVARAGATLILVRGMTLHNDVPICQLQVDMAFNQDVKAVIACEDVDETFLLYALLAAKPRLLNRVDSSSHGTGRLNTDVLAGLEIDVPNIDEQRKIAAVFSAIDDKIELNRKMNKTLDQTAQTLYAHMILGADLRTEKRVIDVFDVTMGQSPPGETYNQSGEGMPFFQGRADFGFRHPRRRVFCTAPTRFAEPGDALVSVRAPVGDVNMADAPCAIGRGVAAVRHPEGMQSFTYHTMRSLGRQFAVHEGGGTVFGSITKKDFHALAVVVPDSKVLTAFEKVASPLDRRVSLCAVQSQTLSQLRDALLPRLMSGELRIEDAKKAVEEVS